MRIDFPVYPAFRRATFTCTMCDKPNRKKTLKSEHTVNPFNRDECGNVRTPEQVTEQSRAEVNRKHDEFMREPVCAACFKALSYSEQRDLDRRRLRKTP